MYLFFFSYRTCLLLDNVVFELRENSLKIYICVSTALGRGSAAVVGELEWQMNEKFIFFLIFSLFVVDVAVNSSSRLLLTEVATMIYRFENSLIN